MKKNKNQSIQVSKHLSYFRWHLACDEHLSSFNTVLPAGVGGLEWNSICSCLLHVWPHWIVCNLLFISNQFQSFHDLHFSFTLHVALIRSAITPLESPCAFDSAGEGGYWIKTAEVREVISHHQQRRLCIKTRRNKLMNISKCTFEHDQLNLWLNRVWFYIY